MARKTLEKVIGREGIARLVEICIGLANEREKEVKRWAPPQSSKRSPLPRLRTARKLTKTGNSADDEKALGMLLEARANLLINAREKAENA